MTWGVGGSEAPLKINDGAHSSAFKKHGPVITLVALHSGKTTSQEETGGGKAAGRHLADPLRLVSY